MVTLNCLVHGDKPAFLRIFPVKVDSGETIGELREKIWKKKPAWDVTLSANSLDLYTPKTPISTASEEGFNDAFEKLNLGTPCGRDSVLDQLNPTSDVEDYDVLSNPVKKVLHVIAFRPTGKCRLSGFVFRFNLHSLSHITGLHPLNILITFLYWIMSSLLRALSLTRKLFVVILFLTLF
jgi:hypothetical protein